MTESIAMQHREGYLHANRGFRGRGEANARGERALPANIGLTAEQRFLFVRTPVPSVICLSVYLSVCLPPLLPCCIRSLDRARPSFCGAYCSAIRICGDTCTCAAR